jgi:hypothetical protein
MFLLSGCGVFSQEHEDKRGKGDSPVAGAKGDDTPANCTNMPNDFGNVCTKCIKGYAPWAVVVTTHTDYAPPSMTVFQAPEKCGGKAVAGPTSYTSNGSGSQPPDDDS